MNEILISIIVPVYNAEKHLSKMLDSVLEQTYAHWELVLVNDGSIDTTEHIILDYLQKDQRIRCFNQSNSGPSIARNKGIEEAKGIYLSFIDADDWVSPLYLEKLIEPMLTTETDMVCAGYYEVNPQFRQGLQLHDFKKEDVNQNISKETYQSNLFNGVSGVLWSKLFKKEIFRKNAIKLNPQLRLSEDLIAVLEYSTYIQNAYIIPNALYYYNRMDEVGLSGQLKISNYQDLKIFLEEVEKYRGELSFINLDAVKNKRKYNFMTKLLRDHVDSKKEFYKMADFLVQNESPLDSKMVQNNKMNDKILKWVFDGKYFRALASLKMYEFLRNIKHG